MYPAQAPHPLLSAAPAARNSQTNRAISVPSSAGVSYYLDSLNERDDANNNFIAGRGVWCETGTGGSNSACESEHLLSYKFDDVAHHGDSGYGLTLTYTVTTADSLASYYEHLFDVDGEPSTCLDLSIFDEFRFSVKGEGNTVGEGSS